MDECRQKGEQLGTLVGEPGLIEIRKQLEDIHNLADDVHDIAKDRDEDLRQALVHADKFQQLQEVSLKFNCFLFPLYLLTSSIILISKIIAPP